MTLYFDLAIKKTPLLYHFLYIKNQKGTHIICLISSAAYTVYISAVFWSLSRYQLVFATYGVSKDKWSSHDKVYVYTRVSDH